MQALSDDLHLAEALLFPRASCLADRPGKLRAMLARRVRELVRQMPAEEIHRHRLAGLPELHEVQVEVPPIRDDLLRQEPVSLRFHYVQWRHADDAVIAAVPALGIEVLAEDERQLAEELSPQIRSALARRKSAESLHDLVMLGRIERLEVRPLRVRVILPSLKQKAQQERHDAPTKASVLKEVATDLIRHAGAPFFERGELIERLAKLVAGRTPRSVLLVGPSGVGKSALVRELARQRERFELATVPFWSTSGSRLIAGMSGYGMWQQRCQQLIREAAKPPAIVHFDNLVELIEVGKGGGNTRGIAAMLAPAIARGTLLAICECTPEQLSLIERDEPQLLEAFTQLEIGEPIPDETRAILAQAAEQGARDRLAKITPAALAELDRLHRRWATYSAAPGRPLRFLRNLLEDRRRSGTLAPHDVTAAFSQETGLPAVMLDDTLPLDLAQTRDWLAQRVMGQSEPVELVTDLLASVKAGLTRVGKPIASLLFIGPTGVGKTELAKALAEFLYQDPGRMIRFDMSEYAHPAAVSRLIGDSYTAQGLLTQKVRDQPFMVVLLDEFEKAHPSLFDVLLQVLGEGRLTDGAGRVADFTNTVVIMTSNLGAASLGRTTAGFAGDSASASTVARHFEREVKAFLRPEMFNRLDRIVSFAPLGAEIIAKIARREISQVAGRDGLRMRDARLDVADEAIERLAVTGCDPLYGARPLKRVIERQLVAPLAERLCRLTGEGLLEFRARLVDGHLAVDAHVTPTSKDTDQSRGAADQLKAVVELRRRIQALHRSGALLRLRNEIARLHQAERQRLASAKRRGKEPRFEFTREQALILAQERLVKASDELLGDIRRLEDDLAGDFYAHRLCDVASVAELRKTIELGLEDLLFQIFQAQNEGRGSLSVAIFGESLDRVSDLAEAYERICAAEGAIVERYWFKIYDPRLDETVTRPRASSPGKTASAGERPVFRLLHRPRQEGDVPAKVLDVYRPEPHHFHAPPANVVGIALLVRGDRTTALLEAETGRHEFTKVSGKSQICFVETFACGLLMKYMPPIDSGRAGSFADLALRRTYDLANEVCRDALLKRELSMRGRSLHDTLAKAAGDYLVKRMWSLLD